MKFGYPEKEFSNTLCRECGSALPFLNQCETFLLISADSLLDESNIKPKASIFSAEKACWLDDGSVATSFEYFPKSS